jgi:hypothetical protein
LADKVVGILGVFKSIEKDVKEFLGSPDNFILLKNPKKISLFLSQYL